MIDIKADSTVKSARRDMNRVGFAVLAMMLLQLAVSFSVYYIIARQNGLNINFYGYTPAELLKTAAQIRSCAAKVLYAPAVALLFATLIGNTVPFAVCAHTSDIGFKKIFSAPRVSCSSAAIYGFVAVGASLIVSMFVNLLELLFKKIGYEFYSPSFNIPWKSPVGTAAMLLAVVIVAPLTEEFVCRGVLLNIFRRFGDLFAVVASSLVWALLHGNFVQGLPVFALGLFFGALALKSDSIFPTFVIHSINNILSLAETVLVAQNSTAAKLGASSINFAILAASILLFFAYYKKFKGFNSSGCKRGFTVFFTCVPMLFAVIYCAVSTVLSVKPL